MRAVADTHALIWYLYDDRRLSVGAKRLFDESAAQGDQVGFSAISMVEIVYLIERGRINPATLERLLQTTQSENAALVELPVNREVARSVQNISWSSVPDMPDRIIAATALTFGLPLISRDRKIRATHLATVW